jgi:hypothetical protein
MNHKTHEEITALLLNDKKLYSKYKRSDSEYDYDRWLRIDVSGSDYTNDENYKVLFFKTDNSLKHLAYTNDETGESYIYGLLSLDTVSNVNLSRVTLGSRFGEAMFKDFDTYTSGKSMFELLTTVDELTLDYLTSLGFLERKKVKGTFKALRSVHLAQILELEDKPLHGMNGYNISRALGNGLSECVYFKTNSEWYPVCLKDKEGNSYIQGKLNLSTDSNLEMASIHLGGYDDHSLTMDFTTYKEAIDMFKYLKTLDSVETDHCHKLGFYFSN